MRYRPLPWLLLVANVLAFLWWHGDFASWFGSPREPDRLRQQVDAERLKILPPKGTAGAGAGGNVAGAGGGNAGVAAGSGTAGGSAGPVGGPGGSAASGGGSAGGFGAGPGNPFAGFAVPGRPNDLCVEIGPLEETRAAQMRRFLAESANQVRGDVESLGAAATWMVYTPPSDSLAIAQRKVGDLRRLGVQDLYLMPDGPYRLGISFGLFRTEEAARAHVADLLAQGVKGLRVSPRGGNEPKTAFRLHFTGGDAPDAREFARKLVVLQTELGVNPLTCEGTRR